MQVHICTPLLHTYPVKYSVDDANDHVPEQQLTRLLLECRVELYEYVQSNLGTPRNAIHSGEDLNFALRGDSSVYS